MVVERLSYIGLGVSQEKAWADFGVKALGLMIAGDHALPRLRMDERAWRIALHHSELDDIIYAGFDIADEVALTKLGQKLKALGIASAPIEPAILSERGVTAGLYTHDPDGLRLEFVCGAEVSQAPFHSDLGPKFVTGEHGLGHFVIAVTDLDRSLAFYEHIGFSLSDYITAPVGPVGKLKIAFLHCNNRHHTLAMAALPGPKRLNHIMIEVTEVDEMLKAYKRCTELGYVTGGVGRHPNDRMLSFYVTTPSGFDIEFGWGGIEVTKNWTVGEYDVISIWGHERVS